METKVQQILDLEKEILACTNCPRLREVTKYPMSHVCFNKTLDVPLFVIGRNPGLEDSYADVKPEDFKATYYKNWLKCKFGTYFLDLIGKENLTKFFFTNVCKCSSPENSMLSRKEKEGCTEAWLKKQIDLVAPKVILAFGKDAMNALAGQKNTVKFFEKFKLGEILCVSLYHPGYFGHVENEEAKAKQETILREIGRKLQQKEKE